jgi:fumarate hydratase class I
MKKVLVQTFLETLRRASTDLSADVESAIRRSLRRESRGSAGRGALSILLENIEMARRSSRPMCQDTGTNTWWIHHPARVPGTLIRSSVIQATRRAVKLGYLRPNSVDPVSGKNSGDNTGPGHPVFHLEGWPRATIAADVLLKGGGCENVSGQLALPDASIGAGRDLEGVRRAVLKLVDAAQGKGCSPGVIGVCIGGDRATGYAVAKEQLLRPLADKNPDPVLARLERTLLAEANTLGVGPMGFGGATTILAAKVATAHRLPASYYVTVAYSCWALRKAHVQLRGERARFGETSFLGAGGGR